MIILDVFLLVLGFVLLIKGADKMVDGSASIAQRFGLSKLMIGLTIIAFGTSAPELIVNILSSIQGSSDIGMGNIIGSNISNILLILGISAILCSIKVDSSIVKKQIPFSVLASIALFILVNNVFFDGSGENILSRSGGFILILFFSIFLYYTFSMAKEDDKFGQDSDEIKSRKNWVSIVMIIGGIIALFFGGKFIVDSAVNIASYIGLSEALIGLTVVAVGTSLPELAASIVAARKKQLGMAIGNVVGSNIFNMLWVLGLSAVIRPIDYNTVMNFDLFFLIYVSLLLLLLVYMGKKHYFAKKEGYILVGLYVAYLAFIIIRG